MLLGAHMSIEGGVHNAPERGRKATCDIIQIFTKNSNQWFSKPLAEEEVLAFRENLKKFKIARAIAHTGYLINLASPEPELHQTSLNSFIDELKRAEALGCECLIFHPGAHKEKGEEYAIKKIAESINDAHEKTKGFKTLTTLETTAGQGTNVGYRFEHLSAIIDLVANKNRMAVCYDTQHTFAAGYDIRTPAAYKKTFEEFDKIVGIKRIRAFHLNDSMKEFASRKDRHEHIGKGFIGLAGFRSLLNDKRFQDIPMSIETPKGPEMKEDIINLKALRKLIK